MRVPLARVARRAKRVSAPFKQRPTTNSSRVHLRRQVARFGRATEPGMLVLDAGAGTSPYQKFFKHTRYEAADWASPWGRKDPLDYECDLVDIPVEDGRFDRILFNQTLEHLPEPARALAELHRVLKPGGVMFCSVPLFYAEHQAPHDYYRFTRFALRRLFQEAGFEITRLFWLEGYFGTVSYQFEVMTRGLPNNIADIRQIESGWRIVYLAPLLIGTHWLAGHLGRAFSNADVRWRYTKTGMCKNYIVLARKPEQELVADQQPD